MNQEQAAARAQDQFAQIFGGDAWVVAAWCGPLGWLVRLTDTEGAATWLVAVDENGAITINPE